jgi:hypothetical protein
MGQIPINEVEGELFCMMGKAEGYYAHAPQLMLLIHKLEHT